MSKNILFYMKQKKKPKGGESVTGGMGYTGDGGGYNQGFPSVRKTGKISIFIEDLSRYSALFGTVRKP